MKLARALLAAGTGWMKGAVAGEAEDYKRQEEARLRQRQEQQMANQESFRQAQMQQSQARTDLGQSNWERSFEQDLAEFAETKGYRKAMLDQPAAAFDRQTGRIEEGRAYTEGREKSLSENIRQENIGPYSRIEPLSLRAPSVRDALFPEAPTTVQDVLPLAEREWRARGGRFQMGPGGVTGVAAQPQTDAEIAAAQRKAAMENLDYQGKLLRHAIDIDPNVGLYYQAILDTDSKETKLKADQILYNIAIDSNIGERTKRILELKNLAGIGASRDFRDKLSGAQYDLSVSREGRMAEGQAFSQNMAVAGFNQRLTEFDYQQESDRLDREAKVSDASGDEPSARWQKMGSEYYAMKQKMLSDPDVLAGATDKQSAIASAMKSIAHKYAADGNEAAQMANWMYEEMDKNPMAGTGTPQGEGLPEQPLRFRTQPISGRAPSGGTGGAVPSATLSDRARAMVKGVPCTSGRCLESIEGLLGIPGSYGSPKQILTDPKTERKLAGKGWKRVVGSEVEPGNMGLWPSIPGSRGRVYGHVFALLENDMILHNYEGKWREEPLTDAIGRWGPPTMFGKEGGVKLPTQTGAKAPKARLQLPPKAKTQKPRKSPFAGAAARGASRSTNPVQYKPPPAFGAR